jgi:hypothetical protein
MRAGTAKTLPALTIKVHAPQAHISPLQMLHIPSFRDKSKKQNNKFH